MTTAKKIIDVIKRPAKKIEKEARRFDETVGLRPGTLKSIFTPPDPAPAAQPVPGRAEDEAKKKVRRRGRGGRRSTILAGRLNAQRNGNNILSTRLG